MLTFNLKKEWFEKIKSGKKRHEYREVKPYWNKRIKFKNKKITLALGGHPVCYFVCGYAKRDDREKRLKAKIVDISIINGLETDLKVDAPVYDIEFRLTKLDGE